MRRPSTEGVCPPTSTCGLPAIELRSSGNVPKNPEANRDDGEIAAEARIRTGAELRFGAWQTEQRGGFPAKRVGPAALDVKLSRLSYALPAMLHLSMFHLANPI